MTVRVERAAIMYQDEVFEVPRPGRHHTVIALMAARFGDGWYLTDDVQGFVLSDGRFVTRKEAARIALENGQTPALRWPPDLYSEDLW